MCDRHSKLIGRQGEYINACQTHWSFQNVPRHLADARTHIPYHMKHSADCKWTITCLEEGFVLFSNPWNTRETTWCHTLHVNCWIRSDWVQFQRKCFCYAITVDHNKVKMRRHRRNHLRQTETAVWNHEGFLQAWIMEKIPHQHLKVWWIIMLVFGWRIHAFSMGKDHGSKININSQLHFIINIMAAIICPTLWSTVWRRLTFWSHPLQFFFLSSVSV